VSVALLQGDARHLPLADASVQCCMTSPPYWGLRDYGISDQLGLEPLPDCLGWATGTSCGQCYVCHLVAVFREVHRVLRPDGTVWCVLGDTMAAGKTGRADHGVANPTVRLVGNTNGAHHVGYARPRPCPPGLKPKDLCGVPWRVAFALQQDGWWLRSAITLCKKNPMPESVTDRPTSATEMMFLLTKSPHYFYDQEAVREPAQDWGPRNRSAEKYNTEGFRPPGQHRHQGLTNGNCASRGRNLRNWWTVTSESYDAAHFATFGTRLITPCLLAGTSAKGCCPQCGTPWQRVLVSGPPTTTPTNCWQPGCACDAGPPIPCTVLDPCAGSGTTGVVAARHGRRAVLVDLNPHYLRLAQQRLTNVQIELLEAR